jgi:hypothetical protein
MTFFRILPLAAALALPAAAQAGMSLTSSTLTEGGQLTKTQEFNGFGCSGANVSPALAWSGAPEGTGSFVVTAYDPDAPTGSGFWHWTLVNLPAGTTALPEGAGKPGAALPGQALQGRNDYSQNAFGGACPPEGRTHRYIFTVYAMPQEALPLDESVSGAVVGFYVQNTALGSASLTVTYGR